MTNCIKPDQYVIILGAMKCGTTSLYTYLEQHPEICPSMNKEPFYFPNYFAPKSNIKEYHKLWKFDSKRHKYALEASTCYTAYPSVKNVPESMYNYGIRPKFIYIVRDPFERILSHFNHIKTDPSLMFQEEHQQPIHTCMYWTQINSYFDYFHQDSFLFVDFDDLKFKPALVMTKVYEHLEISKDHYPKRYMIKNAAKNGSHFQNTLRKLFPQLSYYEKSNIVSKVRDSISSRLFPPVEKRSLTKSEKDFIYLQLREDMILLKSNTNIPVNKWGFN
ncbi:sulfotransferase family protein [Desulfosediminicola ganghwensis]|uniref:sulfotransferase family protein n=1 Tax=Desulfosediminicola ganghwensis TaxID=2569540 RepID=UPI0010AD8977|nr:sulfotransferase domain-containing protein [Desulfosediminicola ganghwensis]